MRAVLYHNPTGWDGLDSTTWDSDDYILLESVTLVRLDGTPHCLIVTLDESLNASNVKLFLDGKLEDQTGFKTSLRSTKQTY